MDGTEKKILEMSKAHAGEKGFALNPDDKMLGVVISGLARRKKQEGKPYCPCRVNTGDPENDAKNVCPCAYHEAEVEQDGHCKCRLFYGK